MSNSHLNITKKRSRLIQGARNRAIALGSKVSPLVEVAGPDDGRVSVMELREAIDAEFSYSWS